MSTGATEKSLHSFHKVLSGLGTRLYKFSLDICCLLILITSSSPSPYYIYIQFQGILSTHYPGGNKFEVKKFRIVQLDDEEDDPSRDYFLKVKKSLVHVAQTRERLVDKVASSICAMNNDVRMLQ